MKVYLQIAMHHHVGWKSWNCASHKPNQNERGKNAQKVPPASLSCGGSSHHLASHDIYDGSGSVAGDSGGYVIHQPIYHSWLVSAPNVIEQ